MTLQAKFNNAILNDDKNSLYEVWQKSFGKEYRGIIVNAIEILDLEVVLNTLLSKGTSAYFLTHVIYSN